MLRTQVLYAKADAIEAKILRLEREQRDLLKLHESVCKQIIKEESACGRN